MQGSPFIDSIRRKSDDIHELQMFAQICQRALRQATRAVEQVDAWHKAAVLVGTPTFANDEELAKAKREAAEIAKFATNQASTDLPYLFALCAVRLWALLEAMVDEIVTVAMRNPAQCADQTILAKLKGPLIEFQSASADDQAEFLAEMLKSQVDAALKPGVGRFEAVLTPVGLGGSVDDEIRKKLFELSQIRNVIVHRSSTADRRLVQACPWLDLQRGDLVRVTSLMFDQYISAAYWYLLELKARVGGEPRNDDVIEAQASMVSIILRAAELALDAKSSRQGEA